MTHEPLARQAPSETWTTAATPTAIPISKGPPGQPPQILGLSYTSLPSNMLQPPTTQGQGSWENSRVESGCGKMGGPAAIPIKNTKKISI